MPKGLSSKVKSNKCFIPVSKIDSDFKSLLRPAGSKEIIAVKLKRKVEYREHVVFEPDRPRVIESSLSYLKANNYINRDKEFDLENLLLGYSSLQNGETEDNNIYNYIMKNATQPLNIITKNSVRDRRFFVGTMKYFRHILMGHEALCKIFDGSRNIFLCSIFIIIFF